MQLFKYICENEDVLCGQVMATIGRGSEPMFRNKSLNQTILPISSLREIEKDRLQIMETSSLRNINYLIKRCIEGIEMLQVFTFNGDPKKFAEVQKEIDRTDLRDFSEMTFSDLVTAENGSLIKRLLEASVKVESTGMDDEFTTMRSKFGNVSKRCSTYFTHSDNVAFIGISLL